MSVHACVCVCVCVCVLLFVPSTKFYHTVHGFGTDKFGFQFYCKSWATLQTHSKRLHPYSPSIVDNQAIDQQAKLYMYWIQFTEAYVWPHLTYYDDFADLEHKLNEADFNQTHHFMVDELELRKQASEQQWCRVSQQIIQRIFYAYVTRSGKRYHSAQILIFSYA